MTPLREIFDSADGLESVLLDLSQKMTGTDYKSILEPFQAVIASREAEMFSGQHDSNGAAWARLALSTLAKKHSPQILVQSGDLETSLIHVGGRGNVASTTPVGLLFGTEVPYASFQQDGTNHIPARPPVGLSAKDLDKLLDQVADQTVNQANA